MPVREIEIKAGNHQFDRKVQELGYCCPVGYIKLHLGPKDTLRRMSAETGVCVRALRYQRAKLRAGTLVCHRRNACMAAIWLTPKELAAHKELSEFFGRKGGKGNEGV